MRIGFLLLCFYCLSSSAANASNLIDFGNTSCSGSQSLDSSNGLVLGCTGDFSLSTGALSSDTSISLFSSGSLMLDAFKLSAPNIKLKADSIYINSNVSLIGAFIDLSANSIVLGDQPFLPRSIIQILPGRNIIAPALSPIDSGGNITLLAGGDISLGSKRILSPASGGDIVISPGSGVIITGSGAKASLENMSIIQNGNVTLVSSVPGPSTFTALLAGLLMLAAVYGRPFSRREKP